MGKRNSIIYYLIMQYDDLEKIMNTQLSRMENILKDARADTSNFFSTSKNYSKPSAWGVAIDLFEKKLDENESRYKTLFTGYEESIADVREKIKEVQRKRASLYEYQRKEKTRDKCYTVEELIL